MFIDGRKVSNGTSIDTDVCIIGTGAAGIVLAREFAGQRFRVCLLESGGLQSDPKTQSLYEGKFDLGEGYYGRLRYFGGSTNHWGAL
jgi:choline dehydrogenase-like flavoprotein